MNMLKMWAATLERASLWLYTIDLYNTAALIECWDRAGTLTETKFPIPHLLFR
jgi:hypothetical protein